MKSKGPMPLGLLDRQMTIVEGVLASSEGLYLNEIADWAGLPKPTAHRIVLGLVEAGMLTYRGSGRKIYVAGPRISRLLHNRLAPTSLRSLVSPALQMVVGELHETSFLARLNGAEVFAVAMVAPAAEERGHVDPGRVLVPHAAAAAKAILAFQPQHIIDRALKPPLKRFSSFTQTDPKVVEREYAKVRKLGYSMCEQEINLGIVAYAVPVFLEETGVLYSVGVTGPLNAIKQRSSKSIVTVLKRASERIRDVLADLGKANQKVPWDVNP